VYSLPKGIIKMATRKTATDKAAPAKDKAGDFKRLAESRVPKAIKSIRTISKLANKASYEYTPEQAERIVQALQSELETLRKQLAAGKPDVDAVSFEV
jgi:hypothetical protein